MVPGTGLEPARCYSLEPESSASANSATGATAWLGADRPQDPLVNRGRAIAARGNSRFASLAGSKEGRDGAGRRGLEAAIQAG